MLDSPPIPLLSPDVLLGSDPLPPPSGPARFMLRDSADRAGPALLRDCLARMGYRYEIEGLRDTPLDVDLSLNMLPDLMIAKGRMHGSHARRTRALADDTDDAILIVNLAGPQLIEQGGDDLVLGDGDAVLASVGHPVSFAHKPPGEMLALRFPRMRFARLLQGGDDGFMRRIPSGTQALSLLTGYVDLCWDERATATPELQQLMVSHIHDLMAVMIGATQDAAHTALGGGVRAARLHAIKRDIESSLDQAELSVAVLAARHGCTPRFLQRLFEAEGTTFTEHVLAQRIARARRMLLDPGCAGEKISAIAYACGFGDVSYFNRAFRRQCGASPSDIRARARQRPGRPA